MFEQFIGTKPVDQRLLFDVGALQSYLGDRVDLKAPVQVEQFRGGQSNPTYRLTAADGRLFVLRRKPPGTLLPSAHAVDREAGGAERAGNGVFPVDRVGRGQQRSRRLASQNETPAIRRGEAIGRI